jgi:hypothetical protein
MGRGDAVVLTSAHSHLLVPSLHRWCLGWSAGTVSVTLHARNTKHISTLGGEDAAVSLLGGPRTAYTMSATVLDEPHEPLLPPSLRVSAAAIGAGGPLQDALPSVGQLRTYASSALHAIRREKVHYCLGCFSCLLVVVISAVLITLINNTPGSFSSAPSLLEMLLPFTLRFVQLSSLGSQSWRVARPTL